VGEGRRIDLGSDTVAGTCGRLSVAGSYSEVWAHKRTARAASGDSWFGGRRAAPRRASVGSFATLDFGSGRARLAAVKLPQSCLEV